MIDQTPYGSHCSTSTLRMKNITLRPNQIDARPRGLPTGALAPTGVSEIRYHGVTMISVPVHRKFAVVFSTFLRLQAWIRPCQLVWDGRLQTWVLVPFSIPSTYEYLIH